MPALYFILGKRIREDDSGRCVAGGLDTEARTTRLHAVYREELSRLFLIGQALEIFLRREVIH
jgi:hypothetical protein